MGLDDSVNYANMLAAMAARGRQDQVGSGTVDYADLTPEALATLNGAFAQLIGQKLGTRRQLPNRVTVDQVMASPPTVGALLSSTGITTPTFWAAAGLGSLPMTPTSKHFTITQGSGVVAYGSTSPNSQFITTSSLTGGATTQMPSFAVEFDYSGAGALEIYLKEATSYFRLWVDGQLVSATPTTVANTGSLKYLPITFAARGAHRIKFETTGVFGGVNTGPTDTITAVEVRGPRVIVVGDSYTAGTGATGGGVSNWVRKMASAMGWSDVWSSGVGGTGYLNAGSVVTFRSRLATDVIAYAPDLVIWAGGHNDTGSTPSALQAEAAACFAQVAAALPNCKQMVLGILWNSGVEALTTAILDTDAALRAAALAAGLPFDSFLTGPVDTAASTTLAAGSSISATTLSLTAAPFPKGSTIEIDTGSTRERRVITNIAGAGPYTYTLNSALLNAHSSGVAVTAVGDCFWTGTGRVGTTTGVGNCDVLVSSDATHPSQEGHDAIGLRAAVGIARSLLAA